MTAEHSVRAAASVSQVSDTPEPSGEPSGAPAPNSAGNAPASGPQPQPVEATPPAATNTGNELASGEETQEIDLDAIERDLNDVQAALDRLNDGTYFVDEVSGDEIPDEVLAAQPTARSATPLAAGA